MSARLGFLVLLAVLAWARPVFADSSLVARSRAHYEKGRAYYEQGRFQDAIAEFQAGFELVPRPLFLLNLGQAYRQLGDLRAARLSYQKFLDAAPANDPGRRSVTEICAELDAQIARLPPEPPPPPPKAQPPPSAALTAVAPPPPRSFIRRHWWIIPTVSVVALTGLGLGLYFGLRGDGDRCQGYSYGCSSVIGPSP